MALMMLIAACEFFGIVMTPCHGTWFEMDIQVRTGTVWLPEGIANSLETVN